MKNSNNIKALKSGIWYTGANFLVRSIGIITTPIFTRLLSHEEFGLFNNYTAWVGILTIIVTLNLESTFISARYDFGEDFDKYIFSVLSLSSISALASALVLNAVYMILGDTMGMSQVYLNSMLIYLLFLPAVNMFQARERYFFRYKVSVALSVTLAISTALLSVLLVVNMDNRLDGRVLGFVAPTIIIGAYLYFLIFRKGGKINPAYWKYALPICIPFIPHMLSLTVLNMLDKIMITNICGAEANALYSLAYSCGHIVTILVTSMNTAFAPWLGQKLHDKEYVDIRVFSKKYVALFLALAIAVMLFSPELLYILGGKSYLEAVYVMPPVACGCICQFLYTMYVNVEQFSRKTVGMAVVSFSAAVLNYILNAVYIPKFGYIAAAYTTLVGFMWLMIGHILLVKLYGLSKVYPNKFILGAACFSLAVTVGINFLYDMALLRYIIGVVYAAAIGAVLLRNRAEIIGFLKKRG